MPFVGSTSASLGARGRGHVVDRAIERPAARPQQSQRPEACVDSAQDTGLRRLGSAPPRRRDAEPETAPGHEELAPNHRIVGEFLAGRADAESVSKVTTSIVREGSWQTVQECLAELRNAGIPPDVYVRNTAIATYGRCRKIEMAFELFEQLRAENLATVVTYNAAIAACTHIGDERRAFGVLRLMKAAGFVPDPFTYNGLILAAANAGEAGKAFEAFEEMLGAGHEPGGHTYSALIQARVKGGCPEEAMEVYEHMRAADFRPDRIIYTNLISACSKYGDTANALFFFERMREEGCLPDQTTYNIMIDAYAKAGMAQEAFGIFESMKTQRIPYNQNSYASLIGACANIGQLERALDVHAGMSAGYIQPTPLTYCALISACVKCQRLDRAREVLEDLKGAGFRPDIHAYGPLFVLCHEGAAAHALVEKAIADQVFIPGAGYLESVSILDFHEGKVLAEGARRVHDCGLPVHVARALFEYHAIEGNITPATSFVVGRGGDGILKDAVKEWMGARGVTLVEAKGNSGRMVQAKAGQPPAVETPVAVQPRGSLGAWLEGMEALGGRLRTARDKNAAGPALMKLEDVDVLSRSIASFGHSQEHETRIEFQSARVEVLAALVRDGVLPAKPVLDRLLRSYLPHVAGEIRCPVKSREKGGEAAAWKQRERLATAMAGLLGDIARCSPECRAAVVEALKPSEGFRRALGSDFHGKHFNIAFEREMARRGPQPRGRSGLEEAADRMVAAARALREVAQTWSNAQAEKKLQAKPEIPAPSAVRMPAASASSARPARSLWGAMMGHVLAPAAGQHGVTPGSEASARVPASTSSARGDEAVPDRSGETHGAPRSFASVLGTPQRSAWSQPAVLSSSSPGVLRPPAHVEKREARWEVLTRSRAPMFE